MIIDDSSSVEGASVGLGNNTSEDDLEIKSRSALSGNTIIRQYEQSSSFNSSQQSSVLIRKIGSNLGIGESQNTSFTSVKVVDKDGNVVFGHSNNTSIISGSSGGSTQVRALDTISQSSGSSRLKSKKGAGQVTIFNKQFLNELSKDEPLLEEDEHSDEEELRKIRESLT